MKLTASHLFKAGARLHRTGACTEAEVRAWGKNLTTDQLQATLAGYRLEKKFARLDNRAGRPLGKE